MNTRGFAGYSPAQRKAVSAKGGRAKVSKGIAKLPPERRIEIARLGGLRRNELLKERKEKEDYEQEKEDSIPSRD